MLVWVLTVREELPKHPRKLARLPLVCQIKISLLGLQEFLVEHSKNLSEGGMFIKTRNPRPVGTMIFLEFRLLDGQELVRVKGEVIWICREEEPGGNRTPGMGIRFVDLDEKAQGVIHRALEYYARQQSEKKSY